MAIYEIIAPQRLKKSSVFYDGIHDYLKRMNGRATITELEGRNQADEVQKIEQRLNTASTIIMLDEKGKSVTSPDFAKIIENSQTQKNGKIQIIIGGADGLTPALRSQADILLSFGKQTWPHMMVRMMILEQLYRGEKIIANHPYHRI